MGRDSVSTTFLLRSKLLWAIKRNRYAIAGGLLALEPATRARSSFYRWSGYFATPPLVVDIWVSVYPGLLLGVLSLAMVGWNGLLGLFSLWLPMTQRGHVVWPELMTGLRGLMYA